ncbi:ATP-binding protein [Clostridium tertium]|uniref:ATP-binding protein n=1 Tax=Clostridium tertium TaxID=1559 RepID=UPI00232D77F4|nr:ATP-binding protein [Clostridium tertium]MDB1931725.1 ATP-binding protein [Clostridium tertium]MDB1938229.1 ATP-binding protein [Clostridium tertium]
MSIFNLENEEVIGKVQSVDTSTVVVQVEKTDLLSKLQVNHLVLIRSSKVGQYLIGLVNKITRKYIELEDDFEEESRNSMDIVKITLIGTFLDRDGIRINVFKRTLESVPEIDSDCFIMTDNMLTEFMGVISNGNVDSEKKLCIGTYTLNNNAKAWLDGNKLFQRHAVIAGSTGSGKSYTVATIIEQVSKLKACNAIVFDIHGEYRPIIGEGIKHYKIAGPSDSISSENMFIPYWLLTYDEMISLMLDRSDNNAPNQAMIFSQAVLQEKRELLIRIGKTEIINNFTIDSPIPYSLDNLMNILNDKNTEMVTGSNGKPKQGDFYGKLSRFIQRLDAKKCDKRLNFMFSNDKNLLKYEYMNELCNKLMAPLCNEGGVKIIDFSEVPSDILPLIVSLIARITFSIQQWTDKEKIHPIALFCDEAHLYIPATVNQGVESTSLSSFERIAKEGRKYGVGLVVITQRPSEVNRTVLSQSSNFIAMRLTNADDQNVVKKLLPDSIGNFAELLPILDIGEALIVGDASLLPSRIKIDEPQKKPNSATVKFWGEWSKERVENNITIAVEALRRQSKIE